MTDPKTHAQATICHGLTDDTSGLARFGWHPDPAIDFCVQVETLESRLHQAQHGLCKPGDEPETVENVLAAIERAMDFRVGGDEGAVNAKAILRELETKARASLAPAPAVPDDVDWTTCGIVEIAARNPSVMEYMRHWEGRAEKAEAALETQAAEQGPVLDAYLDMSKYQALRLRQANVATAVPDDVRALIAEMDAIIDQAHSDLDQEFVDAEHTGERPDLEDSETMIAVDLLERIRAALKPTGDSA